MATSGLLLTSTYKASVFSESYPTPPFIFFFHLKSFLWKDPLTVKVKKIWIRFWASSVSVLKYVHI